MVYSVLRIDIEGSKDILGLWIAETETANINPPRRKGKYIQTRRIGNLHKTLGNPKLTIYGYVSLRKLVRRLLIHQEPFLYSTPEKVLIWLLNVSGKLWIL
jgi:hypothetical protein